MTKRVEIKIALEKFLRTGDGRSTDGLVRDHRRRPILIPETLLDFEKIKSSGRPLAELGRRLRVYSDDFRTQDQSYILPAELCQISHSEPSSVSGVSLPFGTVVSDHGLWVKYAPGIEEVGVNDRGDIILRRNAAGVAGSMRGPVKNSFDTTVTARVGRLVTRLGLEENRADREEAEAWLRALAAADAGKTLKAEFKSAGIDFTHLGNVPYLHETARLSFFDVRDFEMLRIASLVKNRFHKVRRDPPRVTVFSLMGLPEDQAAYAGLLKKLKSMKKNPAKMGLPAKLSESRFYDPASKRIVPANFQLFVSLARIPDEVSVVTVNTDYHGELKSRGVLSPLTAIMSLIDIISAHAGVAVLNKKGTATSFTGPTGTGKTTAGAFWADKNERYVRFELRRRYEIDLRRTPDAGRLGENGIQKELDKIMSRVGILCQEDWIEILKEGAGHWLFWPTERALYARTAGFPGLTSILSENSPVLENVAADFGGSGDASRLGRITHAYYPERVFYDPEWNHLHYDRSPRKISANVLLERNRDLDFLVKRVSAREAIEWLIQGRTADGKFEPLFGAYPDFCALLMQMGVVGEKLTSAYDKALKGEYASIGGGDPKLGEVLFERFDVQVKLWLDNFRELPTYIVNGAPGLELTQDVNWLLSEHTTAFGDWKRVTVADFQKYMNDRYGVTYGPNGEWQHIPASSRRYS